MEDTEDTQEAQTAEAAQVVEQASESASETANGHSVTGYLVARANDGKFVALTASGVARYDGPSSGASSLLYARHAFQKRALLQLTQQERLLKREMKALNDEDSIARRIALRCKLSAELRAVLAERRDVLGIGKPKPAESIAAAGVAPAGRQVVDVRPVGEVEDEGDGQG